MERIIAAAYKLSKPGTCTRLVYKHPSLWTDPKVPEFDDIYDIRIARHHVEIIHLFGNEIDKHTDGFYTSYGRYVDRKEAAKIALTCKQIDKLHYWKDALDSSDIFDVNKEYYNNK